MFLRYIFYIFCNYSPALAGEFWHSLSGGQVSDGYQGQPWYYQAAYSAIGEVDCYETAVEAMEADSLN